ncbi:MAG: DUF3604 domain-containing protein [Myxococcota bacterium]|nr:DUF3604 domain-containing protein [Myxococcota bacterium]
MSGALRPALLCALLSVLSACPGGEPEPLPDPTAREPCADVDPLRNLYWGDLHVHTGLSFDAWFEDVRTSPEQAYDFARGLPLQIQPGDTVQLARPLDFAAVTDHAEFLAEVSLCSDPQSGSYEDPWCVELRGDGSAAVQILGTQNSLESPARFPICDGVDCPGLAMDVWARIQRAAEEAYDRTAACSFTTFVGYEWTGTTGISNIHRNVLFANAHVPNYPTSYLEAPTEFRLWTALKADCIDSGSGCDVLAIPHNANLSNGTMFVPDPPPGQPPAAVASLRAELEPLVEIMQHKGDGECVEGLSGILGEPDEFCAFEKMQRPPLSDCGDGTGSGGMIGLGCVSTTDYLRGALLEGLVQEEALGVNPYRLGVIGSTDTHLGTPGLVEEKGYVGHTGAPEDTAEERLEAEVLRPSGLLTNPGGLMAVWAESNDRPAIFEAMRRKETYATSGPRIGLRFFGGWGFPSSLCDEGSLVEQGYGEGVPMGGVLPVSPEPGLAPVFVVQALADIGSEEQEGVPLQRVQVIKGWLDASGQRHQAVYDVAGGPNDASVNLDDCSSQGTGASSLCAVWQDPDYDPDLPAFWYVRVLENPSCRWSAWECIGLPQGERPAGCSDPSVPWTIQERAWSSPIWSG